jgi:hypothetical protein
VALAAPATLVIALVGRGSGPPAIAVPTQRLLSRSGPEATLVWHAIPASMRTGLTPDGRMYVEIDPLEPLALPDVLLYWAESESDDALPASAVYIGRLPCWRGCGFVLPAVATTKDGYLIAYSLAHGEVVGSARLAASGHLGGQGT